MNLRFLTGMLTLLFFVLVLTGCQSENELLMEDVGDINQISISKTTVPGKLNDDFFATIEEAEELDAFKNAFKNAKREEVKLKSVNYDLLITVENGGNYLLQCYLGEAGEQSAFFFIGHEESVYFTSEEITNELREIIKP